LFRYKANLRCSASTGFFSNILKLYGYEVIDVELLRFAVAPKQLFEQEDIVVVIDLGSFHQRNDVGDSLYLIERLREKGVSNDVLLCGSKVEPSKLPVVKNVTYISSPFQLVQCLKKSI